MAQKREDAKPEVIGIGTIEEELHATQIKQSLMKLGGQSEEYVTLMVGTHVNVTYGNNPSNEMITRSDTDTSRRVKVSDLVYVHVCDVHGIGACVRLIFGDKLFAVAGAYAEKLIAWAEQVARTTTAKIAAFPDIFFQQVRGSVRIHNGEIYSV